MKKFLMALAATSIAATPVISAQAQAAPYSNSQHRDVHKRVEQDRHGRTVTRTVVRHDSRNNHRWAKGQRFDRRYASNYRVISNPRAYRLNAPPRGYHWVQSGNDAVLIAITSGLIGAVIGNAIR